MVYTLPRGNTEAGKEKYIPVPSDDTLVDSFAVERLSENGIRIFFVLKSLI